MSWAEVGRLYVRTRRDGQNKDRVDLVLWFALKGDSSWHIAKHDPQWDPDYPTRYEDGGEYLNSDEDPLIARPDSQVTNRLATDDDIRMFVGSMVTRHLLSRPKHLPLDRWMGMGLLPAEAERILSVWSQSP